MLDQPPLTSDTAARPKLRVIPGAVQLNEVEMFVRDGKAWLEDRSANASATASGDAIRCYCDARASVLAAILARSS